MGATMTQHPEMVKAVVSSVGIYDMLRVELDPNGVFNTTEFGTVKDAVMYIVWSIHEQCFARAQSLTIQSKDHENI